MGEGPPTGPSDGEEGPLTGPSDGEEGPPTGPSDGGEGPPTGPAGVDDGSEIDPTWEGPPTGPLCKDETTGDSVETSSDWTTEFLTCTLLSGCSKESELKLRLLFVEEVSIVSITNVGADLSSGESVVLLIVCVAADDTFFLRRTLANVGVDCF